MAMLVMVMVMVMVDDAETFIISWCVDGDGDWDGFVNPRSD